MKKITPITLFLYIICTLSGGFVKGGDTVKPFRGEFKKSLNFNRLQELILNEGIDINTTNDQGRTFLHQACLENNKEAIEFLVLNDANLMAADALGRTSCHFACGSQNSKSIISFLSACVNKYLHNPQNTAHVTNIITTRDNQGCTPLHLACTKDSGSYTHYFFSSLKGISENTNITILDTVISDLVNSPDNKGRTPLHMTKTHEVIPFLFQHGADPTLRDNNNNTPLHSLCNNKEENGFSLALLLFLCNHSGLLTEEMITAHNNSDLSPLQILLKKEKKLTIIMFHTLLAMGDFDKELLATAIDNCNNKEQRLIETIMKMAEKKGLLANVEMKLTELKINEILNCQSGPTHEKTKLVLSV